MLHSENNVCKGGEENSQRKKCNCQSLKESTNGLKKVCTCQESHKGLQLRQSVENSAVQSEKISPTKLIGKYETLITTLEEIQEHQHE